MLDTAELFVSAQVEHKHKHLPKVKLPHHLPKIHLQKHFPKISRHDIYKNSLSVEPFVGNWCVKEFSGELGTDHDRETRVPIEAYLGHWCFGQFSEELVGLDEKTISDEIFKKYQTKYHDNKSVEYFLRRWANNYIHEGDAAYNGGDKVEIYIGEWCAAELSGMGAKNINPISLKYKPLVPVEPYIGDWCFDTYPVKLGSNLNHTAAIDGLYENHEAIEENLIVWYFRSYYFAHNKKNGAELVAFTAFCTMLFCLFVAMVCYCCCWRLHACALFCRGKKEPENYADDKAIPEEDTPRTQAPIV